MKEILTVEVHKVITQGTNIVIVICVFSLCASLLTHVHIIHPAFAVTSIVVACIFKLMNKKLKKYEKSS